MYDVFVQNEPGGATAGFVQAFTEAAGSQRSGVYLVGSPGLGDLSPRQSNLDMVAVTDTPLADEAIERLSRTHRSLHLHGRDAVLCYTTWKDLAGSAADASAVTFTGSRRAESGLLANPMTWAILATHPNPLHGPDDPAVHSDPDGVRAWFRSQLPAIAHRTGGLLWRRGLTRLVLQATRCAHGAITGEVLSLHEAGEKALPEASHTGHRVITDALGYREGANTSMYWGPFERKANAVGLARQLMQQVDRDEPPGR